MPNPPIYSTGTLLDNPASVYGLPASQSPQLDTGSHAGSGGGGGLTGTWAQMNVQTPTLGVEFYTTDQGLNYKGTGTKWRRIDGDPNEIWVTDFGAVPSFTYPSAGVMTANVTAFKAAITAAKANLGGGSEYATGYTVVCPGTLTGVVYFLNTGKLDAGIVCFEGNRNGLVTGILGWSYKVWIDGTSIPNNDPAFLLDRTSGAILQRSHFKDIGIAGNCTAIKMDDSGIADNAGLWLDNVDLYVNTVAHADNVPLLLADCFWIIWNKGGVRTSPGKAAITLRSGARNTIPYLLSITDQIWDGGSLKVQHNATGALPAVGSWNLDNITTENQVAGDPFIELTASGSATDNCLIQGVRVHNCQRADPVDTAGAFIKINGTNAHKFVLNAWRILGCAPYTAYYVDINTRSALANWEINGVAASVALFTPTSNLNDCTNVRYITGSTHTVVNGFGSESLTAPSSDGIRFMYGGEAAHRSSIGPLGLLLGGGVGEFDVKLYRSAADILATDDDFAIKTLGKGLQIKEGANAKMGRATLVAGTIVVVTTAVTANSEIFLTCQTPGGTPGFLRVSARTGGTNFTILSSNAADTSVVAWFIVEPS